MTNKQLSKLCEVITCNFTIIFFTLLLIYDLHSKDTFGVVWNSVCIIIYLIIVSNEIYTIKGEE